VTPAQLIHAVRRRRGLTQAELAARAGTSQPVISAYENGLRDPTFTTLAKLVGAGGEALRIDAAVPVPDLAPARDAQEHARRLLDVLSLADAVPARRRSKVLYGPRMVSV
jgi:transcriptional regulator with XRE-family HTH domain